MKKFYTLLSLAALLAGLSAFGLEKPETADVNSETKSLERDVDYAKRKDANKTFGLTLTNQDSLELQRAYDNFKNKLAELNSKTKGNLKILGDDLNKMWENIKIKVNEAKTKLQKK